NRYAPDLPTRRRAPDDETRLRRSASGRCCPCRRTGCSSSGTQQATHALQVFGRAHPGRRRLEGVGDVDAYAVPEGTQLLQGFGPLQPAGAPSHEVVQEAGAVGIDADMAAVGHALGQLLAAAGEGIAGPG